MGLAAVPAGEPTLATLTANPGTVVVVAVLAASFLHASWNVLAKATKDQVVGFGVIAITAALWGALVLVVVGGPARASWPYLAVSAAIHVGYNVTLLNSYRFGELSRVYPLARGIAPLLVAGAAAVLTGETLDLAQIVGVGVVAGGLTSLVWIRGGRSLRDRRAVGLALATGVAIAGYSVVDGLGVRRSASPLGYAGALFLVESLVVAAGVGIRRGRSLLLAGRRAWAFGVAGGLLSVTAYSLVLWAQTRAALATVSALRETSVVVAALMGTVLLREGSGGKRVAAAAVVACGVALVVSG